MTRIVSWNIAGRVRPPTWEQLLAMDADLALLQEVRRIPAHIVDRVGISPHEPWNKHLFDRFPRVVRLSDRVTIEWFKQAEPLGYAGDGEMEVSGVGLTEVARISPRDGEPFIAVSLYGRWVQPHPSTNSKWSNFAGVSDTSVHRAISDLSAFIGSLDPSTHRIIVAGDFNLIYGATEKNPMVLALRDRTVWTRMEALGMVFMGPQYPAGRQADPTPRGMPVDTGNVPTYAWRGKPENARWQLDYVFASRGFHESVRARALNGVDEWGASDHCRVLIDVED